MAEKRKEREKDTEKGGWASDRERGREIDKGDEDGEREIEIHVSKQCARTARNALLHTPDARSVCCNVCVAACVLQRVCCSVCVAVCLKKWGTAYP